MQEDVQQSMQSTGPNQLGSSIGVCLFSGILGGFCLLILEFFTTGINSLSTYTLAWAILFGLLGGIACLFVHIVVLRFPRLFEAIWGAREGSHKFSAVWGLLVVSLIFATVQPFAKLLAMTKYAPSFAPALATAVWLLTGWVVQRFIRHFGAKGLRVSWLFAMTSVLSTALFFDVVRPLMPVTSFPVLFGLICVVSATIRLGLPERLVGARLGGLCVILGIGAFVHLMFWDGAEPKTAALASSGPVSASFAQGWVGMTDLDGDGLNHIGGVDCAALDADINSLAMETVGDETDENCNGVSLQEFIPTARLGANVTRPMNVFLVSIDTFRFDVKGNQIGGRALTPNIDKFAAGSLDYMRAYSPSTYTNEAMPSIMSSEYPQRWHGSGVYYGQESTLAQLLGEQGYQTEAVIAFPWLHDGAILGFDYVDNELGWVEKHGAENGRELVTRMFERIDIRRPNTPFLGWIHLFEPHAPNAGGLNDSWLGSDIRGRYLQDIYAADIAFGEFIAGLRARGLFETSVIVFFSDHGEAVGEHNMATHVWASWNSIVHVPLIIHVPAQSPNVVTSVVSTLDIVPTILAALGGKPDGIRDGMVAPPLGPASDRKVYVVADAQDTTPVTRAMIAGDYKVIWNIPSHTWLLFDVAADPDELRPLDEPARLKAMRTELFTWWEATFNDVLLKRKAELWSKRALYYPHEYKGDVGNMLELKKR